HSMSKEVTSMFKNLGPGQIGIRGLPLPEAVALAQKTGFGGIDFNIREAAQLAEEHGLEHVQDLFQQAGVRPGQWGLPVAWKDEAQWRVDLEALPALAALGQALGCTRTSTYITPGSNERDYADNFRWHADRFRPIVQILRDHGCRLGLEFVGPKTSREPFKYPFLYTLAEVMELAAAIGTGNVGLLLDAWHLYTSGGTVATLDRITAEDIVTVHVNDAPAGVPREEQLDNVRRLPMETGVIDLPGFMRKLAELEYDGPVTPEPFSQRTNELAAQDPLKAAQLVAEHMDRMWAAAGLD
ncbi:MAG: sugar phosphate isomerase/epimerase, partial [Anaerolineae bacterium]|nr:sugar phosphate isomerase/epimerase [Anaerolineae bacterium]